MEPETYDDKIAFDVRKLKTWDKTEHGYSLPETIAEFLVNGLYDDTIHFVKGYFSKTLEWVPQDQFALIRHDGDLYSSTMDVMNVLYPKLASGGWLIIDDYDWCPGDKCPCRRAITEYRSAKNITTEIVPCGGRKCWQKE